MKDNLDIEKLFKDKFENFEGDVNPNLWNNISQGISTNAAASTGIGLGVKALLVSASVVAVGVTTYFVGGFNQNSTEIVNQNTNPETEIVLPLVEDKIRNEKTVIIAEDNDPVITENEKEIIESLSNQTVVYNDETKNVEVEAQANNTSNSTTDENTTPTQNEVAEKNENQTTESTTQNDVVTEKVVTEEKPNIVFPNGKLGFTVAANKFEYNFSSNAKNHTKVEWNFGDGKISNDLNPNHIYAKAGQYKVKLMLVSKDNEVYEETKTIDIKTSSSIDNIPNVITPNGDRVNDQFVIKTTEIETFSIVINDKFGNKVFESNDKNFTWDGTNMSGDPVEKGMYIYYILAEGKDGTVLKIPGQIYVK